MTREVFSFVYMQELKIRQYENYRQKSKSKQAENEMVFLERKMFWKVDKHKRHDQSSQTQTEWPEWLQAKVEVRADRKWNGFPWMFWKVDKHKRNDQSGIPLPILHLFGITIFFCIHARAERSPERKLQAKVEVKADRKWNGFPWTENVLESRQTQAEWPELYFLSFTWKSWKIARTKISGKRRSQSRQKINGFPWTENVLESRQTQVEWPEWYPTANTASVWQYYFLSYTCKSWTIARTKITRKSRSQSKQKMKRFSLNGKCFEK